MKKIIHVALVASLACGCVTPGSNRGCEAPETAAKVDEGRDGSDPAATTEVERLEKEVDEETVQLAARLEKAIIEKEYIVRGMRNMFEPSANDEWEQLRDLAYHEKQISKDESVTITNDVAKAVLERVWEERKRRERWYCKRLCADIGRTKALLDKYCETPESMEYGALLYFVAKERYCDPDEFATLCGHAASNCARYARGDLSWLKPDRRKGETEEPGRTGGTP